MKSLLPFSQFGLSQYDVAEASLSPEDLAVMASFGVGDVVRSASPATGTVNRTVLVETPNGLFVLRCSSREQGRVEWEHVAIAWAAGHGAPVCRPLALANGETIRESGGVFYALFPFARGQQVARGNLQTEHARAAGECLARLHAAFAAFPMDLAPRKKLLADITATLAAIPGIERAIGELSAPTETERAALSQLAARRNWLRGREDGAEAIQRRMADLPQSVLHGDYQETNLFFEANAVAAVIDWDQSGAGPRSYDILRAMHLMLHLNPELCSTFLEGYRNMTKLPDNELEEMADCYGILSDNNLWVFSAAYQEGNERAKQFIGMDPFIPFVQRWREMRS